jgi:predicted dehydrogenase
MDVVRQLVTGGDLGEIVTVTADHGQYFVPDPAHRLFAPELAGGALLDLGIYPISFAAMVLGAAPDAVHADGSLAFTGVDAQAAVTLRYGQSIAQLGTTLLARTPTTAAVNGSVARVELAGQFYMPATVTYVHRDGERVSRPADPIDGHEGLAYQAAQVASLLAEGATESPLLPLDETTAILATIDEIRRQLGVVYPGE